MNNMKLTLNIVGAGKVGKVLGQQFFKHQVFNIQDVFNRTAGRSAAACEFIGAGKPVTEFAQLRAADIFMLTVPDDQIRSCAAQLQSLNLFGPATLVFHCSGALSSAELGIEHGAASLHPMRSFADPDFVARQFTGTICSLEGNVSATQVLSDAMHRIAVEVLRIDAAGKLLYHAAGVFASNYLVTLMDAALKTFVAAGISPEMAGRLAQPLAQETFNNIFRLGTQQALTGPIARGDLQTVSRHQEALKKWNLNIAQLYTELARSTTVMKNGN